MGFINSISNIVGKSTDALTQYSPHGNLPQLLTLMFLLICVHNNAIDKNTFTEESMNTNILLCDTLDYVNVLSCEVLLTSTVFSPQSHDL